MKSGKLAAALAVGWLLMITPAIGHAQVVPGVFCSNSFNPDFASGGPGFTPQVLGCTAIDGGVQSINACITEGNYVLGCAVNAFACQPSGPTKALVSPGSHRNLKDCACSNFISPLFN
jgi:hypothetical protein